MSAMRIQTWIAALISASVLFFSCSTVEEPQITADKGKEISMQEAIITASMDDDAVATRTSLLTDSDKDEAIVEVQWTPGDKIKIFSAGESSEFTSINTEPKRIAKFKGMVSFITGADDGSETDYVWGLYPYRADATYTEPEEGVSRTAVITTTMPSAQTAKEGTFNDNLAISIGRSESLSIPFKNVYSGLRFTLTRDDIVSVTLSGNGG